MSIRTASTAWEGRGGKCEDFDKQVASSCYYCSNGTNAASHCSVPIATLTLTPTTASPKSKWSWKRKLIIGGATVAGKFWLKSKSNLDLEARLQNQGALTIERYKFSYVKKITNSLKDKLGEGGFGAVYKGKLRKGSLVAVKILNSTKGNGQDFINEVTSISKTSHVNVVRLLGYCLEGNERALIYEFMAKSSLDKYIYHDEPENIAILSRQKRYKIAIGTANHKIFFWMIIFVLRYQTLDWQSFVLEKKVLFPCQMKEGQWGIKLQNCGIKILEEPHTSLMCTAME